jgi:hypothetical protein
VLAPATLAALQSIRALPDRDVFYVADPISSIPDLWQQEAVRALQQGKDPPSPRLRRDKRGGAGADSVAPMRVHALHPTLTDMLNHAS